MSDVPVISGQIPPLADAYSPRGETGLGPAAAILPGTTIVLVPGKGAAGGRPGRLGGTGKTHLAADLALALVRDHAMRLVVWVTATGRDAVVSSYAQALRDLGAAAPGAGPERAASQFIAWLARTDWPWIVVLDELAGGAVPDALWPRGATGRVLVTTDRAGAAARADRPYVVPVGPFSPREALAYLSAHPDTDASYRIGGLDLAGDLGFLPLALSQARAAMTVLSVGCREYRSRLAEHRARLTGPAADGEVSALAAAWSVSAEVADSLAPAGLARRVLALVSMLAPHGIPSAVLASDAACEYLTRQPGGPTADRARVSAAVRNLARAGLVSIDPSRAAGTVLVHPAVQAITRMRLSATEGEQAALAAAQALFQVWSRPEVPPAIGQRLRDCTASLHELAGPLLWKPGCHPVLFEAGRSLDSGGLDGPAAAYWHTLLARSQQALGTAHADTILIRDHFGAACEAAGLLQEAIAVYEQVFTEQERARATGPADTEAARASLVRAYSAAGRDDDAIRLAQGAVASSVKAPGPGPDSMSAQESLARAYFRAGQLPEAVEAFRQVLARRERAQGPHHPQTIAARGELATACWASGQFKEAITLCTRTLADFERVRGADHPDTLAARRNLAAAYHEAKKFKNALPLYERTLADRERVQGSDHSDTISARGDLAAAYLSAGKLAYAISQYEQALADCRRVFGPDHRRTRTARDDLNAAASHARSVRGIDLRSARR